MKMKLDGESEFYRLALETILSMCMNDINGKRILKVEGFLSLTVESGEIFCIVIKEALDGFNGQDVDKALDNLNGQDSDRVSIGEDIAEGVSFKQEEMASDSVQLFDSDLEQPPSNTNSEAEMTNNREENATFLCSFCEKPFKTVRGIERHIKMKHSKAKSASSVSKGKKSLATTHPLRNTEQASDSRDSVIDSCGSVLALKSHLSFADAGDELSALGIPSSGIWEVLSNENKVETLMMVENATSVSELVSTSKLASPENINLKQEVCEELTDELSKSFDDDENVNQDVFSEHKCSKDNALKTNPGISAPKRHCEICHKGFASGDQLFRHCQRSHKIEKCIKTGQSLYKCFCCGKVYPKYSELKRHRGIHHRVKPFTCHDCNISFSSQGDQIYHRMKYHRKRTCNQCQFVCSGLIAFTEHVRTCHPGIPVYKINKQLVCEFCSGTYANEKYLNDHIQSKHLGHVHTCDVCGKVLGSAETLRIHRRLHEVETYRTCEICGKQFGRLSGLMEHMRSKHPENVPEKYRCSFKCQHCGLVFSRQQTLRRHSENKHEDKTFTCDICGRIFRCKRYIVRHKKIHHPGVNSRGVSNVSKTLTNNEQCGGETVEEDNN